MLPPLVIAMATIVLRGCGTAWFFWDSSSFVFEALCFEADFPRAACFFWDSCSFFFTASSGRRVYSGNLAHSSSRRCLSRLIASLWRVSTGIFFVLLGAGFRVCFSPVDVFFFCFFCATSLFFSYFPGGVLSRRLLFADRLSSRIFLPRRLFLPYWILRSRLFLSLRLPFFSARASSAYSIFPPVRFPRRLFLVDGIPPSASSSWPISFLANGVTEGEQHQYPTSRDLKI